MNVIPCAFMLREHTDNFHLKTFINIIFYEEVYLYENCQIFLYVAHAPTSVGLVSPLLNTDICNEDLTLSDWYYCDGVSPLQLY
jgi:hypothetical protein